MRLPPAAWGVAGGIVAMLLLAPLTGSALGDLATARADRAALAAQAEAPARSVPIVVQGLSIGAGDAASARAAIAGRVQQLAKTGGVLVEQTGAARAVDGLAAVRIRVSGSEKAVFALADALERGRPLVRLRGWEVAALPGGGVRLTADAVGAWR